MGFNEELEAICDQVPGCRSAMVMSLDGIAVASHQQRVGGPDTEALLIELINPIKQAAGVMDEVGRKSLTAIELTTAQGSLLVELLKEDHLVALVLDRDALTGQGRFALRMHRGALNKELL